MRSFRLELAFRYAVTMAAGMMLLAGLGYWALRATLDRQIDASLLNVASIQAASVTDDPGGDMRFQEWAVTSDEARTLSDLMRYAQIWSEEGSALVRSRYLTSNLPLDTASLRASADGKLSWAETTFGDQRIRSIYYPLGRLGATHSRHVLQVAAPLGARNATLRSAGLFFAALVLLVAAGSVLGSWWLAGKAVYAVHEITEQAEGIGAGTMTERISAHAESAEFARLVQVLNTMLDRIDEALVAQRRFTADASHELRSPLTALRGELELARRRDRTPEEYRRVIDSALEETERITQLTEDLLTLARSDAGVMQPRRQRIDVAERVNETLGRLQEKLKAKSLRVEVEVEPASGATGAYDPDLIDRLVWNLVDNAIKFTSPTGTIRITTAADATEVVLEVADTGPGIREGEHERIFERFNRTDAAHSSVEGTGLGLSIVRAIAEAHGGHVSAHNRRTGGALFRVRLPRAPLSA